MIVTLIFLTVSLLKLDTAIPISCGGIHPEVNFNSIKDSISSNYTDINDITDHPFLGLLKELGETNVKRLYNDIKYGIEAEYSCYACKAAVSLAKFTVFSTKELNYLLAETCSKFGFEDYNVCKGLSNLYTDELYYILKHSNLTNDEVCGILLGAKCMSNPCSKLTNWDIDLSSHSDLTNKQDILMHTNAETVNILHLSDLHVDPYYEYEANSNCGEPLCCRSTSAKSKDQSRAGFWGDYNGCDTPIYTLQQLMKYINVSFASQYQYVIWTGDITAHDVWNTTKHTIINGIESLTQLISSYVSNGKMVFPVIGNHEGLPVNQFSPPEITGDLSNSWLYSELLNRWKQWIPSDSHQTFKRFGYYSSNVTSKIKVIVLNTNYCARLNFWLLYNSIDPADQLKWMAQQLHSAEISGQFVHIIGHIPPDNTQCIPGWVHNYLLITERYQNIIKAQFFGHSHFDEFRILFSSTNKSVPIGVTYLGPSITPYEKMNPAFRLYNTDDTGSVLDHQTYYLNLTNANLNRKYQSLEWILEYSAKSAYNISHLVSNQWNAMYEAMRSDDRLFQAYYNHYHRYSDAYSKQCLDSCRNSILDTIAIYDPISCTS